VVYVKSCVGQNWLLPLSIRDMIPKDHICFLVEDFVESLDFSKFDMIYEGAGRPAYHPRVLLKVLVYGSLCNTRSSRKLAKACLENFVFMYLAEKLSSDFRTINRFRKDNADFFKSAFKETVSLASKNKLLDLSFLSIDGSTFKASAGSKRYVDEKGLDKLDKAIDKMIDDDIALDELEDELFGDCANDGLTGIDRRDIKKIVREFNRSKDKKVVKKNVEKAKNELEKYSLKKVSISDPESRAMQTKKRFSELSYNVQLSTSRNQFILANDVCRDKHDVKQFVPQIKNVKENISLTSETKVALDCGYSDGENLRFAEDNGIDLYVPSRSQAQKLDGKEESLNHDNYEYDEANDEIICEGHRYQRRGVYTRKDGRRIMTFYSAELKKKKDIPYYFKERLRMKEKMATPEAKRIYDLRKITVEPVYGHIKQNMSLREFLLRGLEGVKIEVNLVSIAHNLKKIHKLMGTNTIISRKINQIMKILYKTCLHTTINF
jgi:transposase